MISLVWSRQRKMIAIAGGVLLLIGIIYRFLPSFDHMIPSREDISIKEKKILSYHKKVIELDSLEGTLKEFSRTLGQLEAGLLAGDKPALAAVDIQNTIREITQRLGIEVSTMSVLKPIEGELKTYNGIPVQFTFNSTITQLARFLHQLSTSTKILTIDSLRILSIHQQKEGQIQSTLTVTGFMRTDKSS